MKRHSVILSLLLAGATVPAQEVRMHVYYDGSEGYNRVVMAPTGVQFAWVTQSVRCSGSEPLIRSMDDGGRFTTSESSAFIGCYFAYQPVDAAVLPSGTFLIANGWYLRLFDASGFPLGPEFIPGTIGPSAVAALGDRFVVVGGTSASNPTELWGIILMEDGSMPYPARELPQETTYNVGCGDGSIGMTPSGGCIVVFARGPTPSPQRYEVLSRLFDNTLLPISGDIPVDPGGRRAGQATVAPTPGGYVVVWSEKEAATVDYDVVARFLDPGGNPTGTKLQVTPSTLGNQLNSYVASDASGRFVVSWSESDGDGSGTFAQRFSPAGVKLGPSFRANGNYFDTQIPTSPPAVRADGSFIIPWYSYTDPDGSEGSFFRRYYFPVSLLVAPGPGSTNAPMVQAIQPDGLAGLATFPAYGAGGFGANVGAGDIDADGLAEALTGPGPSGVYGPQVHAFRATGSAIQKVNYYAYGTLRYGVRVAGGEIDGDAFAEILTAPGAGPVFGPHIRGWNFDGASLQPINKINFFCQGTLKWGAQVSSGDIDGDGMRELLTAPGPGAAFAPQVRGWNYDGLQISSIGKVNFCAWPSGTYGATVGAADIESDGLGTYGDGYQEIVVGRGYDPAVGANVKLFNFDATQVQQLYEITAHTSSYGANVAGGDADAGDIEEVATAPGPDPTARSHVTVWEWDPVIGINPYGPALNKLGPDDFDWGSYTHGANVAIGTFQ